MANEKCEKYVPAHTAKAKGGLLKEPTSREGLSAFYFAILSKVPPRIREIP